MNIHADKTSANKSRAVANRFPQQQSSGESTLPVADNQPTAIAQRKRQKPADNSTRVSPLSNFQGLANNPQAQQAARWQSTTNNHSAQPIQKQGLEEEELLQGKFEPIQKKENTTGLPDNLKSGVENLSGMSLDHVKVHYNSDKPAQLQAHAYAQGTDIHIAPGQEKHLPHEAWHVVQQAQGRVQPTMQMKGSVPVNDDAGLEREADVMGAKAATVVNISNPLGIFQRRVESAEAHTEMESAGGQGEKGTLNFLSSGSNILGNNARPDAISMASVTVSRNSLPAQRTKTKKVGKNGPKILCAENENEARILLTEDAQATGFIFDQLSRDIQDKAIEIAQDPKQGGLDAAKSYSSVDFREQTQARAKEDRRASIQEEADQVEGYIGDNDNDIALAAFQSAKQMFVGGAVINSTLAESVSKDEFISAQAVWDSIEDRTQITNFHSFEPTNKSAQGKGNVGDTLDTRTVQGNLLVKISGKKFNVHVNVK